MAESSDVAANSDTPSLGISPDLSAPGWGLDERELKVLRALAAGGGAAAAALILFRSVKTVEHYVSKVHKKMGTSSTVRCVLLAERAGLLEGVQ